MIVAVSFQILMALSTWIATLAKHQQQPITLTFAFASMPYSPLEAWFLLELLFSYFEQRRHLWLLWSEAWRAAIA